MRRCGTHSQQYDNEYKEDVTMRQKIKTHQKFNQ